MRDIFILGFIFFLICAAMARPFLMSMAYIYVDLVSPQRITFYLLNAIPFSMIMAILAILFWGLLDDKKGNAKFGRLQIMMVMMIVWITLTTALSQLPQYSWIKWSTAWKSIAFGVFLPYVLRTRQRIEVALYFVVLCVGVLTITGGIKTLAGGGGYGTLNLMVESNSGLYEGSTISAVAVALIPVLLYLYRHNTLFHRSLLYKLATGGLIFSALLIPIGTEARTGLICIAVLGFMLFLKSQRKFVTVIVLVVGTAVAMPLLPSSFTSRMGTIKTHKEDESASTRVAVWSWTMDYVKSHPLGGGFDVYRLDKVEYDVETPNGGTRRVEDHARAFHSSYFETLGEHGYPGLALYIALQVVAILQMRGVARRFRKAGPEDAWIRDLANTLQQVLLIFMAGSAFVGIAFQTTLYILLALSASLAQWVLVRDDAEKKAAMAAKPKTVPVLPPRGALSPAA